MLLGAVAQMHFISVENKSTFEHMTVAVFIYGIMIGLNGSLGRLIYKYSEDSLQNFSVKMAIHLGLYMFFEFLMILFSIILLYYGFDNIIRIYQDPSIFADIEDLYSFIFNSLFFSSQTGGSHQTQSSQFWKWIGGNCPDSLNEDSCLKPFSFSPSSCAADYSTCMRQNGHGFACPYDICRSGVRSYGTQCMLYITCCGTLVVLTQITLFISFPVYLRTRKETALILKIVPSKRHLNTLISTVPTVDSGESTRDAYDVLSVAPSSTLSSSDEYEPESSRAENPQCILHESSFSMV